MLHIDLCSLLKGVTVPYVPILGAVHPSSVQASWEGLLGATHDDAGFLPYDKAKRWGGLKAEKLLKEFIQLSDTGLVVPTVQTKPYELIRVYIYTDSAWERLFNTARAALLKDYPLAKYQAIIMSRENYFEAHSVVFLAEKDALSKIALRELPYKTTLLNDANQSQILSLGRLAQDDKDNAGFSFLAEQLAGDGVDGAILAVEEGEDIVGAIGPLRSMKDANNLTTRYPVYFGVSECARHKGVGQSLWGEMSAWALDQHVDYIALQARKSSPAESFYRSLGLKVHGYIAKSSINPLKA